MNSSTISAISTGLNQLEGIMIERRATRRSFIRNAARAFGLAAAAAVAIPAAGTLAAIDAAALKDPNAESTGSSRAQQPGGTSYQGIDFLRAWASGALAPQWLPGTDWQIFMSPTTYQSYFYPRGWDVSDIVDGSRTGAWFSAPDDSVAMGAVYIQAELGVNSQDGTRWQLEQIVGDNDYRVIYDDFAEVQGMNGSFVAVDLGQMLLAMHCIAIETPLGVSLTFAIEIGTTELFDAATQLAFLPFLGQFVAGGGGGGGSTDDDDDDDDSSWGSGEPGDIINTGTDEEG